MRSMLIALVLAAPMSAVAATPNYTHPVSTTQMSRATEVLVTFVNPSPQDRELVIGEKTFKVSHSEPLSVYVAVGTAVREFSQMDSKVNGQQVLQVSANDAARVVVLR